MTSQPSSFLPNQLDLESFKKDLKQLLLKHNVALGTTTEYDGHWDAEGHPVVCVNTRSGRRYKLDSLAVNPLGIWP